MGRQIGKAVNKDGTVCRFGAGISGVFAHVHQAYLELLTCLRMQQLRQRGSRSVRHDSSKGYITVHIPT